jgi:4-hydroxy-3-polyprenylbenzoate decarboxylase
VDVLDHSSRAFSYGSKLIVDGTTKMPEEGGDTPWTPGPPRGRAELPAVAGVLDQDQPGGGLWFASVRKSRAGQGLEVGAALAASPAARGVRLVAVVDDDTDVRDPDDVMWTVLNNIDPERDARVLDGPDGPVLALDGTRKLAEEGFSRKWPDKITMSPEVRAAVDALWPRLGLGAAAPDAPDAVPGRR